ncbi:MAG TPA: hypothetical protein PKI08_02970 [Aquaticitalea sp.]|nr:hypothetical protein [Aquaticitalea sp.]
MLRKLLTYSTILLAIAQAISQTVIKDETTKQPVSFATISFGNGNGVFADDEGSFIFTEKLYPDIDTLYISALGYKDLVVPSVNLGPTLYMKTQIDHLNEVVIRNTKDRKFKEETLKPYLDDDYYHCWLPTIESEIAVYFPNDGQKTQEIAKVHIPVTLESKDWEKRKKANTEKQPFSTLFKVKFYYNDNGQPGKALTYETIVFRTTEKNGNTFVLDVSQHTIDVPDNGFFVSLQVLGYTDHSGKLLPNKKYKEIKDGKNTVKIPTNFRPLLPFTDKIPGNRTFIKRVFINDNKWSKFEKDGDVQSGLLKLGLNNYGIGVTYKVFREE